MAYLKYRSINPLVRLRHRKGVHRMNKKDVMITNYETRKRTCMLCITMCYLIAATGNVIVNAIMGTTADGFLEGMLKIVCIFVTYITCAKLYTATSSISSHVVGIG